MHITDGVEDAGVDAANNLQVALMTALPVGNNNIGNVDLASSIPSGSNTIGRIIITDGTEDASVDVSNNLHVALMTQIPAGANTIGSVNVLTLPSIPAGTNNIGDIDVLSLPSIPTGSNVIGDVGINGSIPAGTNNIGDVDVLTLPAIPTGDNTVGRVKITDGTDLLNVNTNGSLTVQLTDGTDDAAFTSDDELQVVTRTELKTPVRKVVEWSSAQTAQNIWDPTNGTSFVITAIIISIKTACEVQIFDNTDTLANRVAGEYFSDNGGLTISFPAPQPKGGAADNVLKYTSSGGAGTIIVFGYEV